MQFKVITYNIMSCREYKNIKNINPILAASVLKKENPDIIGLNEVHGAGGEFSAQTVEICRELGYDYCYFCPALFLNGSFYGNALISRYPILSAERIMVEDPVVKDEKAYYETRCIIKARIDVGEVITVYVTHFGLANAEKKNAVKALLDNLDGSKTIFMGDLNVMPDNEFLLPIKEVLNDTAITSDKSNVSFPSDNPTMKLDYIFTSKDIKTLSCGTIENTTSDHYPYFAEIEI
ncbi:MAG: endonuclease/exonuclease/phosphatase family protein [Clostridia bacterium]|nr:endonuclease/exonuclease/phosphatase family protein [Clostridia bacterium]